MNTPENVKLNYLQVTAFRLSSRSQSFFPPSQTDTYEVTVTEDLGEIQLIKIEKRKYWFPDDWYLKYITVKTPVGDYLEFPCYRWITDEKEVVFRDGRGKCISCSLRQL